MDLRASLLALVGSPDRAWFTLLIGYLLIVRELSAPGRVLPGILGGVAVLTAAHALVQYGVTMLGVLTLVAGVLLAVLQGFRQWWYLPTGAAAIALAVGARMLMAPPARLSWTAAIFGAGVAVVSALLFKIAVRAHRNKVSTVE